MKMIIKNGRVLDPVNQVDTITDILIQDGKIKQIGKIEGNTTEAACIDALGQWIVPGIVDLCHRPYLKHPHGTTLMHEAQVAVQRGMTALCIPPDGDRVVDHPNDLIRFHEEQDRVCANLYSIAALTKGLKGQSMTDYALLKSKGCVALSQAQAPLEDRAFLRSCYLYAAPLELPIIIQPQVDALVRLGLMHEGVVSTRLGVPGIPYTAETMAIQEHLSLIEEIGIRAHFTCLSSYQSVALIAQAKDKGLKVTADVAMHSLLLTEMDLLDFDGNSHVYPPLRSQTDQLGLLKGLQDQVIDAICSDHRPLDISAKLAPFGETVPGMSTIDGFLSLGLYLVEQNKLELSTLIRAITANPAQIIGLSEGDLSIGSVANLCVIDPNARWTLLPETMLSKGKNSAFIDWQLPGKVTHTLINGHIVYQAD